VLVPARLQPQLVHPPLQKLQLPLLVLPQLQLLQKLILSLLQLALQLLLNNQLLLPLLAVPRQLQRVHQLHLVSPTKRRRPQENAQERLSSGVCVSRHVYVLNFYAN